jgi:hypothetical protein
MEVDCEVLSVVSLPPGPLDSRLASPDTGLDAVEKRTVLAILVVARRYTD